MKYYIIAGEASGDLHGSRLIREIKKNDAHACFRAWGGDLMMDEKVSLVKHYREMAFMGFIEVFLNIKKIISNLRFCKKDILSFQPDVIICIDYPGFNLPITKFAKHHGFKTVYYISPQVWAWKEKRVYEIKKYVDLMLVILPFEKSFYKRWNYDVEYVGHPLIEIIEGFKHSERAQEIKNEFAQRDKKIVAIIPGSRIQEIQSKLPIMLKATARFENVDFIVAQAPGIEDEVIINHTKHYKNVSIWKNKTYELLSVADAAVVTSGTATLETALFGAPEVVCYKTSWISFLLARFFIKVKFISLVNIIMDKLIVKELIQNALNAESIYEELALLLTNDSKRSQLKTDFQALHQLLLSGGNASKNAAEKIQALLIK
ncbi:MAG: hypothetical protein RI965_291 [Bacteroidota bacterium]|jgi:lipid-A-disaccharide synthase